MVKSKKSLLSKLLICFLLILVILIASIVFIPQVRNTLYDKVQTFVPQNIKTTLLCEKKLIDFDLYCFQKKKVVVELEEDNLEEKINTLEETNSNKEMIDNREDIEDENNNNINEEKEDIVVEKVVYNTTPNIETSNFSKAKSLLKYKIYRKGGNKNKTFYCNCLFTDTNNIDFSTCGFESSGKYKKRTNKVEWEHVVPAESFGQSFSEWRVGHKDCVDSKGKRYKGRKCAGKNPEFARMEGDLYNLMPAIGEVNALRSNYTIAEIPGEESNFGKCNTEIYDRKVEPRDDIKGDVARVYLYMDSAYPGKGIISEKNRKLIQAWDKLDPISEEECLQYRAKKEYQKNINGILEGTCEEIAKNK